MVDRLVSVDDGTGRLPKIVRDRLAQELADPASEIGGVQIATYASQSSRAAISTVLHKMKQARADQNWVINSDSTGATDYRWPRQMGVQLAALHPEITFRYSHKAEMLGAFPAPVALNSGTGPRVITIWNAAISGAQLVTQQVDARTIFVDTNPDLIFVSQGHNEGTPTAQNTWDSFRARYAAALSYIQELAPSADIVCIGQNPSRTATAADMPVRVRIINEICQARGYGFIDVCQAFLDQGANQSAFYEADNLHPNAAGGTLWAKTVVDALFRGTTPAGTAMRSTSSLIGPKPANLLTNGDFTNLDGNNVPVGWTAFNATLSKDFTNADDAPHGYGLRMLPVGMTSPFILQTVASSADMAKWRGKTVTLLVKVRNNSGAAQTTNGGIMVIDGVSTFAYGVYDSWSYGAFVYRAVTIRIAATATQVQVRLYGDLSTTGATDTTWLGAWLVEGNLPHKAQYQAAPAAQPYAGPDFISSLGSNPSAVAAATSGAIVTTANNGLQYPIRPHRNISVGALRWMTGSAAASGNYDIAILSATGTRLWSKGVSACPAANTVVTEVVFPKVLLLANTDYYLEIASDDVTMTAKLVSVANSDQWRSASGGHTGRTISGQIPIPATPGIGSVGSARTVAITVHEA